MAEKYLTVLNKDEIALGYLTNAKGVEVQERLNGEALISFEVPYDTRDATLIEYEGFIKFNGQLYVIKNIEPSENNPRRLVVRAVHVYIELVDEYIDREIELFGGLDGTLQNAVNEVLRDTHFTVGTAISNEVHDFHIYEINALKALQEIAELWNVDVWFDKRTVHVGHRGEYRNAEIRYGKNLKSLSIPTSSENIITRLYIYGKDGLTIEGVNNGVKYLDSPLIGNYKRPKCGEVRFNDIDDPNELMQKGQLHLEKVDKPDVSYSADFIYLSKLGYDVYDEILTGDEIVLTHGPFGIDRLPLRVIEYRYRPFEPGVGSVTLSNTKDSLVDVLVQLAKSKNTVAKALDKNGRIQSNKLDIAIQQATQAMRNAQTELEFPEGLGIIARNVLNSNKFITYNSEGIGFTKDGTTFNQALTHDGLVITKGTVGRLDADVIVIGGGTTYEEGYDPATIADAAVSDFVNSVYANDKATLQNQIDGNITSWFYDYDPTLTNVPALDWITDEMKNNHLGDLFYNSTSGYAWRFALENGVYKWVLLKDTDVTKALQDAQKAQDTADKKRRVFVSQPVPPYDIGDLWSQGTSGELMRCITAKSDGQTYSAGDWEKAVKYTDDTLANAAKTTADEAKTAAENAVQKGVKFDNSVMIGNGNGIKILDASDVARVILGQYAAGKYGLKVTNGEIYGSLIKTGGESATTYISLNSAGSEPLKVVKNSEDALNIGLYGDGGSLQFYDTVARDMRGQIYPHNDAMGQGLRIHARGNNGSSLPLHLSASWIPMDGDVSINGNLSVTGYKPAKHLTENYGYKLLMARESPEFRFIDEGQAELVNGECRIDLDPIFLECIEPNTIENKWHIHCTPYANMSLYVSEVGEDYFILKDYTGIANGIFSWTLSGVRRGFAGRFLPEDDHTVLTSNWEDELLV